LVTQLSIGCIDKSKNVHIIDLKHRERRISMYKIRDFMCEKCGHIEKDVLVKEDDNGNVINPPKCPKCGTVMKVKISFDGFVTVK